MQITKVASNIDFRVDTETLTSQLRRLIEEHARLLDGLLWSYRLLYVGAILFLTVCFLLFLAAITAAIPTYIGALALGSLVFASCVCFIGHRYLNLQQPERLAMLTSAFGEACQKTIPYLDEIDNHHLFLASAYTLFAEHLKGRASTYFQWRYLPASCSRGLIRLSDLCHRRDLHILREQLLTAALHRQLDLVKRDPLNLTYHSQLASTYVLLSRLFLDEHSSLCNIDRFRYYTTRAVNEFQIIATYAPNDLWIHAQLAMSYRDLQLVREEVNICETILKLCPTDGDTLLRLGILYFQLGDNAKGLSIYEELRHLHWQLAEQLIIHYGVDGPS